MKMTMSFFRVLPIMVVLTLSVYTQTFLTNASATLLDINFGAPDTNKVGFAAIGQTTNDYWNGYQFGLQTYGSVTNLKWVGRHNSGISVTVLNAPGNWANDTGDGMYDPFIYPWDGGNITVTLSNVPSGTYDFYLYGHSSNAWENTRFQMTVGPNSTLWKQTQDSILAATSTNWAEGVQYVVFRNMTISDGQPVVITGAPGDAGAAILNGLQMISSSAQQGPPVITSFAPTSAFTGSNVVITGLNFSPVASSNIVYFGAVQATVTAASTTSLTVMVPAGAIYAPITETVNGLTAYSAQLFLPTFAGGGQISSSSLTLALTLPTVNGPTKVVITDLDGDGRPDLVIPDDYSADILIYQNISSNGTLAFAPWVKLPMTNGESPVSLVVADMDGDGKPDIVIINNVSHLISILRNVSSPGTLTTNSFAARMDIPLAMDMQSLAIQDLNGDGKPDIVVANGTSNSISILQNQSTIGNISLASPVNFQVGNYASDVAIADFDGDGNPDLAVLNMNDGTVSVFRNFGGGGPITSNSFAPQVVFPGVPLARHLCIGDMDGDGKLDIATADWTTDQICVLRNLTSGPGITSSSFAPSVSFGTGGWANDLTLGDLNGDGKLDIVVPSQLPSLFSIFQNTSTPGNFTTGSLGARVDFGFGFNPDGPAIGDLNGDGKPDLVLPNDYGSNVFIFVNSVPIGGPPQITGQPQDVYVHAFDPASFSVTAIGATSYNWFFNGSSLPNATASNLTFASVVQSNLGPYLVVVTNNYGAVTSSIANLYMYPSIITPFAGLVTDWGQNTELSIGAWGTGPLTYQWYDNGILIPNATNSTLTFSAIQFTNAGSYSVVVSSSLGSVTNTAAQVVVNPAGVSLGLYPGLTITGTVGYTYNIQSNPDLTNTNSWTTVATVTLWQPTQFWVDVNNNAALPTNQHRYYRVLPAQ